MIDYALYGVPTVDMESLAADDCEFAMYTLPEDKQYSIFFEVFTTAGVMNVPHGILSKAAINRN